MVIHEDSKFLMPQMGGDLSVASSRDGNTSNYQPHMAEKVTQQGGALHFLHHMAKRK